jgi:hypothetical protein
MLSIYILEFIGTITLAFMISLLGKGYAHILLGSTLLLTGTLFANNCFNPAIALCYLITSHITFPVFIYYIIIELIAAVTGFTFGKYIKDLFMH